MIRRIIFFGRLIFKNKILITDILFTLVQFYYKLKMHNNLPSSVNI